MARRSSVSIAARKQTAHPYIMRQENVCGGRSVVAGTRIPVWSVIKWYKLGMAIEDIIREFPQLKPAQVHDAFSYYYDNMNAVEKDIADNEDEDYLKSVSK
jgi:type III restriction enzyme